MFTGSSGLGWKFSGPGLGFRLEYRSFRGLKL